ncbi:MAG: hypothetical protein GX050_09565 [Firmicutes bacterium]|nr:hypothetical protein [Bacillota bacterium]
MLTQDFNREFILSQLLDLSEFPILLSTEGLEIALRIAQKIVEIFQAQKRLYICGLKNYQYLTQDLAESFYSGLIMNRPALPVHFIENLTGQESLSSALGNQEGEGNGLLIVAGEHAQLAEVLLKEAKALKLFTMVFCGYPPLKTEHPEILFYLPGLSRPRLKELFLMLGHIICTLVESTLYSNSF